MMVKGGRGILETLDGAEVLLTGGSGFMGKVLIEKLLRCTNVSKIYVVIRAKRGLAPQTRILEMFKLPLFELVRKKDPNLLKKVIPLEGDLSKENFGLDSRTVASLQENIRFVFNFAASLKLEDTLKQLIVHNTVSVLRLLEMATSFKKLEAFVHLSTAFCHCEEEVLEERLYEPPANPHDVIAALEWMDEDLANAITPKLLGPHPNCYTYTKRLAEGLLKDYSTKLPISVVRPSIVTPAIKEPIPGWVDSLNGPMGVLVAGAKGVLRSMLCDPSNRAEVVPVDCAINSVIITAWQRANTPIGDGNIPVYNISSGEIEPIPWGEVLERGRAMLKEYPLDAGLWYPGGTIRTNPYTHAMVVFFAQVLPAYFIDFLFFIFRQKRFMVHVQNRIRLGMVLLQYFTMRQWNFIAKNFLELNEFVPESEKDLFFSTNLHYDINEYMKDGILGARRFCLKEPLENLPRARRQMMMLYWLEKICQIAILSFIGFFLYNNVAFVKGFFDSYILTANKIQK